MLGLLRIYQNLAAFIKLFVCSRADKHETFFTLEGFVAFVLSSSFYQVVSLKNNEVQPMCIDICIGDVFYKLKLAAAYSQ